VPVIAAVLVACAAHVGPVAPRAPWAVPVAFAQSAPETTAASDTTIPAYEGYVTDRAHLLDDDARAKLEAFLDQVQKKTGAQFAVLTVPTTAPADPVDYKVTVFQRWGIGRKGEDNGVLLLVAMQERHAWFETGYGLEGVLPDGLEARIIREEMVPRFRAGDYAGGLTATVVRAAARIAADKKVTLEWNGATLRYDEGGGSAGGRLPWVVLIFVAVVLARLLRPRRGPWPYYGNWGGRWGGWGGGWGGGSFGGFGGGGGGGGGSFGGFGGGSSGGGGGGGGW